MAIDLRTRKNNAKGAASWRTCKEIVLKKLTLKTLQVKVKFLLYLGNGDSYRKTDYSSELLVIYRVWWEIFSKIGEKKFLEKSAPKGCLWKFHEKIDVFRTGRNLAWAQFSVRGFWKTIQLVGGVFRFLTNRRQKIEKVKISTFFQLWSVISRERKL